MDWKGKAARLGAGWAHPNRSTPRGVDEPKSCHQSPLPALPQPAAASKPHALPQCPFPLTLWRWLFSSCRGGRNTGPASCGSSQSSQSCVWSQQQGTDRGRDSTSTPEGACEKAGDNPSLAAPRHLSQDTISPQNTRTHPSVLSVRARTLDEDVRASPKAQL